MKIEAAIFDIDGTVLDTERIYMEAWRLAAASFGYPMPEEALAKTRSIAPEEAMVIFRHYCGESFDYHKTFQKRVDISEQIFEERGLRNLIKPGVLSYFDYLSAHGIKKAAASMTVASRTYAHLEKAQLLSSFDVVFTGDDVKNGKPDPEIFLRAAAGLGADPAHCIVCEDSSSGIRAGAASGAKVFMIPDAVPMTEDDRKYLYAVLGTMEEASALTDELLR